MFNPQPKPEPRPKKEPKRIRRRSKKRANQESKYNSRRKAWILENPTCAVTGEPATEVHHMKGREGDLLLDERFWLPVSHDAHMKITEHSKWAIEMGFSLPRNH